MFAVASTAEPGAWPWALRIARSGSFFSATVMSTTNLAEMNPTPTFALALKWSSSITSIDSTPGPQLPTWFGSMRKAHTRSRGAAMSTVPLNCIWVSGERPRSGLGGGRARRRTRRAP